MKYNNFLLKTAIWFWSVILLAGIFSASLCTDAEAAAKEDETVRILLVGNSLTKYGSHTKNRTVQSHLERMAEAAGKDVVIKTLAHGGARLKYWAGMAKDEKNYKAELLAALRQEDWDYVVLQEYSKTPYLHYERDTVPAVKWLQKKIKKLAPGAKVYLYMPHGYDYSYKGGDGERIRLDGADMTCYTGAAHARLNSQFGIEVIPAGLQFYRVSLLYPETKLLGEDNRHPTRTGYFLIAGCIYYEIFGEEPVLNKKILKRTDISRKQANKFLALLGEGIKSSSVTKSIAVQESFFMKVHGIYGEAVRQVRFRSLSPEVAEVDEATGEVCGVSSGQAVIVAETKDGKQAFCTVFVDYKKPDKIKAKVTVKKGSKKARVKLTWNGGEGVTYRVYRSASANGAYKLLATVTKRQYTDKTAKKGRTWYYRIITVDEMLLSEHRASKAVKVVINGKN